MEENSLFSAKSADGLEILHDPDFIVDRHHRNKGRVGADRPLEIFHPDEAVFLNIKIRDFVAFALQMAHGVEHGLVLGLHGDEMTSLVAVEVRRAFDGEVVAFRRARRDDDLTRISIDERRNVPAPLFNRLLGRPAVSMAVRGRVAKNLREVWHHLLHDAGIARRRRRIVKISRKLHDVEPRKTAAVLQCTARRMTAGTVCTRRSAFA